METSNLEKKLERTSLFNLSFPLSLQKKNHVEMRHSSGIKSSENTLLKAYWRLYLILKSTQVQVTCIRYLLTLE